MEPVEAIEFMTEHHFRNRHPEAGEHLGLLFTYYELVVEQHIREKKEKKNANGVSESGGGSAAEKGFEVDSGRERGQSESSGERDSMAIRDDAGSQDSTSQDTGTDGESGSGQDGESGIGGRAGVERPPEPDTPLKSRLAYWTNKI
ncbi:MAG: hypothetical protein LKI21_00315 [Bifidobacterium crudilactis]|jgi:hypothetical protein|nr:hypothetical protein [Bifidobacterium crudilactis]